MLRDNRVPITSKHRGPSEDLKILVRSGHKLFLNFLGRFGDRRRRNFFGEWRFDGRRFFEFTAKQAGVDRLRVLIESVQGLKDAQPVASRIESAAECMVEIHRRLAKAIQLTVNSSAKIGGFEHTPLMDELVEELKERPGHAARCDVEITIQHSVGDVFNSITITFDRIVNKGEPGIEGVRARMRRVRRLRLLEPPVEVRLQPGADDFIARVFQHAEKNPVVVLTEMANRPHKSRSLQSDAIGNIREVIL